MTSPPPINNLALGSGPPYYWNVADVATEPVVVELEKPVNRCYCVDLRQWLRFPENALAKVGFAIVR